MSEIAITQVKSQTVKSILRIAMELIKIKSVTDDKEGGIEKCQNRLIEIANMLNFKTSIHANGKVVIIEPNIDDAEKNVQNIDGSINKKRAKLGIVMHLDTVPLNRKRWTHNPLGELSDGYLYGRGVIDDKGPIAIALEVMNSFEEDEISSSWQIIVGSCEEGAYWEDMSFLVSESKSTHSDYVLPEFLVTVDGDGVKLGSRGYADLDIRFDSKYYKENIVKEDALKRDLIKEFVMVNPANNVIPNQLEMITMQGNKINSEGKSVHSSIPEEGKSAICTMALLLKEEYKEIYNEYKDAFDLLINVDSDSDGTEYFGEEKLSTIKSCFSATRIEFDEEKRQLGINLNLRLGPEVTLKSLSEIKKKIASTYNASYAGFIGQVSLASTIKEDLPEVAAMEEAYFEVIGKYPNMEIERGIGYNAALPNCAIFGPRFDDGDDDEEDLCHQPDERRSIKNIVLFYEMLRKFVYKVLNENE